MAYETFEWCPRVTSSGSGSFSVLTAKFGDGYSQEAANGINTDIQTWSVEFTGTEAEMNPILVFLRAHKGYRAFVWTPPMGEQGYYKAKPYNISPLGAGVYTVTTTFVEDFKP